MLFSPYYLLVQGLSSSTHRVPLVNVFISNFVVPLAWLDFRHLNGYSCLFQHACFSLVIRLLCQLRLICLQCVLSIYGFSDRLCGSDRLARLLRGMRRSHVAPTCGRLPSNIRLLRIIRQALATPAFDNIVRLS